MPALIADKLVSVQPMTQPASLIFYLRYQYGNKSLVPAPAEVIGAIVLWFNENYPGLELRPETDSHNEIVPWDIRVFPKKDSGISMRVAVLVILDGEIQFYDHKFDMYHPNFFDKLGRGVTDYFWPQR